MEEKNLLIPTNKIEGDITSCKIENQVIFIRRDSPISLVEYTTYASYDVCSKEIINQYTVPSMTGVALIMGLSIALIFFMILGAITVSYSHNY